MSTGVMSRSDERRENLAALVASVIIHLLLILGAAWFLLRANTGIVPPKPLDEEPVRLTILPPAPTRTRCRAIPLRGAAATTVSRWDRSAVGTSGGEQENSCNSGAHVCILTRFCNSMNAH
jgi:hypothetical protein